MEINPNIQNILKKLLPNIELCNEIILHNKVQGKNVLFKGNYDLGRIIPKGKKCLLWFKIYKNKLHTYLFELHSKTKIIMNIFNYNICFHKYLTNGLGTILYGTFTNKTQNINTNLFTIEDIIYYKGNLVQPLEWKNKLVYYNELFSKYLKQVSYLNNDLICIMPYTFTHNEFNLDYINSLNELYNIYCIQYLKSNKCYSALYISETINKVILKIKPQLQNDIYDLYYKNTLNDREEFLNIACVPDYKTSVLLNKYFRNIKENINLDYLEESDSEEEFENINIDKYVYLNNEYLFECIYNEKFKMWVPTKYICDCKEDSNYINKLSSLNNINSNKYSNKINNNKHYKKGNIKPKYNRNNYK